MAGRGKKLIGEGVHGQVYRFGKRFCRKIYKDPAILKKEYANLKKAVANPRFPRVYWCGNDFMVREYIEGVDLLNYLQTRPLTESISQQLLELLQDFEELGFKFIDTWLHNVIITPEGYLRPVDLAGAMKESLPYPKKLLAQLDKVGKKQAFVKHVKRIDWKLYKKWKLNGGID